MGVLVAIGALAGFVVVWIVIGRILVRTSGWAALAEEFPAGSADEPTQRWRFQFVRVGWVSINGGAVIAVSRRFLHLSVMRVFLMPFAPIALPWDRLDVIDTRGRWVRLIVKGTDRRLTLPASVWDARPR